MDDPEVIYLQPECTAGYEGRMWCEHAVEACDCAGDKHPDTKYVRADAATARGAARLARMHGKVSVVAYSAAFDAIVDALAINPVLLARAVMTQRMALAGSAEVA